ncbi:MAG: hypothetical protein ACTH0V_00360 [Microbacteriaceae bacterium]
MSSSINPAARAAREHARQGDGQFGNQQHTDPDSRVPGVNHGSLRDQLETVLYEQREHINQAYSRAALRLDLLRDQCPHVVQWHGLSYENEDVDTAEDYGSEVNLDAVTLADGTRRDPNPDELQAWSRTADYQVGRLLISHGLEAHGESDRGVPVTASITDVDICTVTSGEDEDSVSWHIDHPEAQIEAAEVTDARKARKAAYGQAVSDARDAVAAQAELSRQIAVDEIHEQFPSATRLTASQHFDPHAGYVRYYPEAISNAKGVLWERSAGWDSDWDTTALNDSLEDIAIEDAWRAALPDKPQFEYRFIDGRLTERCTLDWGRDRTT